MGEGEVWGIGQGLGTTARGRGMTCGEEGWQAGRAAINSSRQRFPGCKRLWSLGQTWWVGHAWPANTGVMVACAACRRLQSATVST